MVRTLNAIGRGKNTRGRLLTVTLDEVDFDRLMIEKREGVHPDALLSFYDDGKQVRIDLDLLRSPDAYRELISGEKATQVSLGAFVSGRRSARRPNATDPGDFRRAAFVRPDAPAARKQLRDEVDALRAEVEQLREETRSLDGLETALDDLRTKVSALDVRTTHGLSLFRRWVRRFEEEANDDR